MRRKEIVCKYYFPSDILYIQLLNKTQSVGDQEFQDEVILFRDSGSKEVIGIEIMDFIKSFKEYFIQVSKTKVIDFHKEFRFLRAFISLQDIMFSDPEEVERIMGIWGYKKVKSKKVESDRLEFPFDCSKMSTKRLPELVNHK